jgi:hypothetical protein
MARTKGSKDSKPRKPRSDKGASKSENGEAKKQAAPTTPPLQFSEEEQRGLFVQGIGKLEELVKLKDEVIGKIRNQRGQMEARGFSKSDIDFGLKLRGAADKEADAKAKSAERRRQIQIAQWLNHPLAQMDLFDGTPAPHQPIDERAYEEGKIAGYQGLQCTPPVEYTGPTMQKWISGWQDGQSTMVRENIRAATQPQQTIIPQDNTGGGEPEPFEDAMEDADQGADDGGVKSADQRAAEAAKQLSGESEAASRQTVN